MAGKGLGTGLGALFGDAAFEENSGECVFLPISRVEPRRGQPRTYFDDEALEDLARSIREHGIIQPLTVRKLDGGLYQIIAGERRWRAARIAGLTELPARIIEADDRKSMELALVENLQREDLNPVEEAYGYQTLIKEYGLTQEQTALSVGKSRPVITNSLRLLTLPADVLELLESGKLVMSSARALLELDSPELQSKAAKMIVEKGLTVREISSFIKKMAKEPETDESQQEVKVDYVAEVEKDLTRSMGRKVKIAYGKRKGKIELEYYGEDDFENLCKILKALNKQ